MSNDPLRLVCVVLLMVAMAALGLNDLAAGAYKTGAAAVLLAGANGLLLL